MNHRNIRHASYTTFRLHPRSPLFPYTTLFRSGSSSASSRSRAVILPFSCCAAIRSAPPPSPASARFCCNRKRRSEEHTSELQSLRHLVCRLLLVKKKMTQYIRRDLADSSSYTI